MFSFIWTKKLDCTFFLKKKIKDNVFLFVLEYNETSGFYKLVNNIYDSYRRSETGKFFSLQMYPSLGKFVDNVVFKNGEEFDEFNVSTSDVVGYLMVCVVSIHFFL